MAISRLYYIDKCIYYFKIYVCYIYIYTDIDIHKYYIADNIIIFQICMYIYYYYILNIKYYILYYILYIKYDI
jgi:hypothetical protein